MSPETLFCERMDRVVLQSTTAFEQAASQAARYGIDPERLLFDAGDTADDDPWTRFVRECVER